MLIFNRYRDFWHPTLSVSFRYPLNFNWCNFHLETEGLLNFILFVLQILFLLFLVQLYPGLAVPSFWWGACLVIYQHFNLNPFHLDLAEFADSQTSGLTRSRVHYRSPQPTNFDFNCSRDLENQQISPDTDTSKDTSSFQHDRTPSTTALTVIRNKYSPLSKPEVTM